MLLSHPDFKPLTNRDYLGFGLWSLGFLIETIADFQKSVFRNNPENKVLIFHFLSFSDFA